MKMYWLSLILLSVLLSACGDGDTILTGDIYDRMPIIDMNGEGSEESYYLTGILMESDGKRLLVDTLEAGLLWVSFQEIPAVELLPEMQVRISFDGTIEESYPGQARGVTLEIME